MTGVGADFQMPAPSVSRWPTRSVMPLARTVQWAGAVTVNSKTALRSGWSKAGKTRWMSSMNIWV